MTYSYFDTSEKGMTNFVRTYEPFPGYWASSERYVLKRAVDRFIRTKKTRDTLLDLGCGEARLGPVFYPHFSHIIGIDPGAKRIYNAKKKVSARLLRKTTFITDDFMDVTLPKQTFDTIVCSHVIQHVPNTYLTPWFDKMYEILKPNGLLFLMTSIHQSDEDEYVISRKGMNWEKVDKETFEKSYHSRCLIGRNFSIPTLDRHLRRFQLRSRLYYHSLYQRNILDLFMFRDRFLNVFGIGKYTATDILIVAQKKSAN